MVVGVECTASREDASKHVHRRTERNRIGRSNEVLYQQTKQSQLLSTTTTTTNIQKSTYDCDNTLLIHQLLYTLERLPSKVVSRKLSLLENIIHHDIVLRCRGEDTRLVIPDEFGAEERLGVGEVDFLGCRETEG